MPPADELTRAAPAKQDGRVLRERLALLRQTVEGRGYSTPQEDAEAARLQIEKAKLIAEGPTLPGPLQELFVEPQRAAAEEWGRKARTYEARARRGQRPPAGTTRRLRARSTLGGRRRPGARRRTASRSAGGGSSGDPGGDGPGEPAHAGPDVRHRGVVA
jgi:hypothetical protein